MMYRAVATAIALFERFTTGGKKLGCLYSKMSTEFSGG
jgi:hypothetical protein